MRIKKFKKSEPTIGNYVICEEESDAPPVMDFIRDNIGKFIRLDEKSEETYCVIQYDNIPPDIRLPYFSYYSSNNLRPMLRSEILFWSDNKEDLEIILNSKKYNL